ncbi:hypothetical protein RBSWK_04037 [Rhodopirellula baltica SWK14]|uniref:Uncharacterized protein n=1 Tax=Rhodopirellula baltica SWK14 TaxID=993516 RepID=L7CCW6_RHOBT|nr:hypothetical protein RBSWK_04037 [Rhodopirellula baltica SWK14]
MSRRYWLPLTPSRRATPTSRRTMWCTGGLKNAFPDGVLSVRPR